MSFDVRTVDLRKLSSLTKYPSIETYHELDPKGGLLPVPGRCDGPVVATEKVDGTNARIVFLPDGSYLIGSREEFLYAMGDLLANPAMGLVEAVRPLADRLLGAFAANGPIVCVFGELFGARVTAASKQYTGSGAAGYRLFDVGSLWNWRDLMQRPLEQISAWRESEGPDWLPEAGLHEFAQVHRLELTPRVWTGDGSELPAGLDEMEAFVSGLVPRTRCALDEGAGMRAEGVVLRSPDRRWIRKARLEDYARTRRRAAR
ncbi:MAG: RNA ligase family protein [Candidatus Eremiobacterota bacterium]